MIAVENLIKDYGRFRAVDGVTFSVAPGEVLGFLGPNGAGKSTTMKILSGFLPASSGHATVAGFDVSTHSLEVRQNLGYLAEHNALYTDMHVSEYLTFIASMRQIAGKDRRARVDEVVVTCDLEEYYYRPIGTLSKGFRQRVGLAAAMIHDPKVLILDEPTSGLDPIEIKKIRELIRMLGRTKTVILSTHILQEVEATCDRMIIIARGRIIADSTPQRICRETSDEERVQLALVGDADDLRARLGEIDGVIGVQELPRDGARQRFRVSLHAGSQIEGAVKTMASRSGATIDSLKREAYSLEDAFEKLVTDFEAGRSSAGSQSEERSSVGAVSAAADSAKEEA